MKTKHQNAPPEGERWIWLTATMMQSDAWRTASANVNCRRFMDFAMVEFMQHGGSNNGNIKTPFSDLVEIGISRRLISGAIDLASDVGLVDCHRSGMRVATRYTLNWLPSHDGTPPNNRWKKYRDSNLKPWPKRQEERKQ